MIYELIYIASMILHCIGIYWGVKCVVAGEELFCRSSPSQFFVSRIERKFWTVIMGMASNVCFLLVKPAYIWQFDGNATGWQEPLWAIGHISIGLSTAIWHHMSYEDIIKIKKGP